MDFQTAFNTLTVIITEGAIIERLRREYPYPLDPHVMNAGFVYKPETKAVLEKVYREYIDLGKLHNVPLILFTPTWRANPERLQLAGFSHGDVNGDNYRFLSDLRRRYGEYAGKIFIGGLMGCRGDAYDPREALNPVEAFRFHQPQAKALSEAGVDFLFAATMPALSEAYGMAQAMASTMVPYIISFIIRSQGTLLDGTPLSKAISDIDAITPMPAGYMINCVHPTVFEEAITNQLNSSMDVRERILGLQANTSRKPPEELDGSANLDSEEPGVFGEMMVRLNTKYGLKILGGCCGTNWQHIRSMIEKLPPSS